MRDVWDAHPVGLTAGRPQDARGHGGHLNRDDCKGSVQDAAVIAERTPHAATGHPFTGTTGLASISTGRIVPVQRAASG